MLAKRIIPCLDVKGGGGVRTRDDIRNLLSAGADKVSINTAAVADPEFVRRAAERFGSQCTVVAIDARAVPGRPGEWEVYTHGGAPPAGVDGAGGGAPEGGAHGGRSGRGARGVHLPLPGIHGGGSEGIPAVAWRSGSPRVSACRP